MFFLSALSRSNKFEPAYNVCQRLLIAAITTADNQKKKKQQQPVFTTNNKQDGQKLPYYPPPHPPHKNGHPSLPCCHVPNSSAIPRRQKKKTANPDTIMAVNGLQ